MSGLDWFAVPERLNRDGLLSDDAVALAAVLEFGFVPNGEPGLLSRTGAGRLTGWRNWSRFDSSLRELRRAGLLTGKGNLSRPFRYQFPTRQEAA